MAVHQARANHLPYEVVAGAVPCPKGWLVIAAKIRGPLFAPEEPKVIRTFGELINDWPQYAVLAVQAPLGLLDSQSSGERTCDRQARLLVGAHYGAVRIAPTRSDLEPEETPRGIRELVVLPRFREIADEFSPFRQRTIYEVHPELSFFELNGHSPLCHARSTTEGRSERIALLDHRVPLLEGIVECKIPGIASHRIVDAAACLWSAKRIFQRVGVRLPIDPEWNEEGIRMEIVR